MLTAWRMPTAAVFLLLIGLSALPCRLDAQTKGGDPEEEPDMRPGTDPGSDVDPSLVDPFDVTLGSEMETYLGDLDLLSKDEDPEGRGLPVETSLQPVPAPQDCDTASGPGSPVLPDTKIQHYFVWKGAARVLAGVSADAGCHLFLDTPGDPLKCRYGSVLVSGATSPNGKNYTLVLDDAKTRGFNKLRLWVTLVNESHPDNVPFAYQNGYWNLNVWNEAYFNRLREVVNYAKARDLVVEVTFFAPYQGDDFSRGAWARKVRGTGSPIGFSQEQAFVVANDSRLGQGDRDMLVYQKNIIDWTVKKLWCYDNVFWEIANEPDGFGPGKIIGDPVSVAAWQKTMINYVRAAEGAHAKHAIAVQPFTSDDLAQFVGQTPPAGVINGHYATANSKPVDVFPAGGPKKALDRGALQTIRSYYTKPVVFGFNETKITPFGDEGGTKSHLNGAVGTLQWGVNEPARAEGLEFLFDQGGIYEHWGYLGKPHTSPVPPYNTSPMRAYIPKALSFFNERRFDLNFPLTDYKTMSIDPNDSSWSNWFRPGAYGAWEPTTSSRKNWAALTTRANVSTRVLLYYVHHSTPRCKEPNDYFSFQGNTPACQRVVNGLPVQGELLAFNAFDARIWTNGNKYRENLTMLVAGTYDVTWIDPETMQPFAGTATQTVVCGANCGIQSPLYKYDAILKIVKQ